jgi:hypothetical protein
MLAHVFAWLNRYRFGQRLGMCLAAVTLGAIAWLGLLALIASPAQADDSASLVQRDARYSPLSQLRQCPDDIGDGEAIECSIDAQTASRSHVNFAPTSMWVMVRITTTGSLAPQIRIYQDATGNIPNGCLGFSPFPGFLEVSCFLPSSGNYTIVVNNYNGIGVGNYILFLQRLTGSASNARPLPLEQTIFSGIATSVTVEAFDFSVVTRTSIIARMFSTGNLAPHIRIYDSAGNIPNSCLVFSSYPGFVEVSCVLPTSGNYRLITNSYRGQGVGSYQLFVQRIDGQINNSQPLPPGQLFTQSVSTDVVVNALDLSTISSATMNVRITTSETLAPHIRIYDSAGNIPNGCLGFSSFTGFLEVSNCKLPSSGDYRILVNGYRGQGVGSYQLSYTCIPSSACKASTSTQKPIALVLVYAVLDNNLGLDRNLLDQFLNSAQLGAHSGISVSILLDGPGANDSRIFTCPSSNGKNCNGLSGEWLSREASEDTAQYEVLKGFVKDAIVASPNASRIALSLVGHGSGWHANGNPGQPTRKPPQPGGGAVVTETNGGMMWDDHPGNGGGSRSMSTAALGGALREATAETGRMIDLIYLDACSMGAVEVVYQLRESARYVLASANTDWASFAYDRMFKASHGDQDGLSMGKAWLLAEHNALPALGHPHTLALYQIHQVDILSNTVKSLATVLRDLLPTNNSRILAAANAAERYEENYDGKLYLDDYYVDLYSFAQNLMVQFSDNPAVRDAAQAVAGAVEMFVVEKQIVSGNPWLYPTQEWRWQNALGVSLYAPFYSNVPKRLLYTPDNLDWARDTGWDQVLTRYWSTQQSYAAAQSVDDLKVCISTVDCNVLPEPLEVKYSAFLPVVMR